MSKEDLARELAAQVPAAPPDWMPQATPDKAMVHAIRTLEKSTICGGRFTVTWGREHNVPKPWQGLPLNMFCAAPGCIETGECTGPAFVPSFPQYTHVDPESPLRRIRKPSVAEMVRGAYEVAKKSPWKRDPRTEAQIRRHIAFIWDRIRESIEGAGNWSR